jgi:hypothetical protein
LPAPVSEHLKLHVGQPQHGSIEGLGELMPGRGTVQVISFKNTALFKRGIWLSAVTLIVCVAAPFMLDGTLWGNPVPHMFGVVVLSSFLAYFLWKLQLHRLADEVADCDDHLQVRRGRISEAIPLSNISGAGVSSFSGIHLITVQLHEPTKLGAQFAFLPQASLWSNPPAVERVAAGLRDRANQAKSALVIR